MTETKQKQQQRAFGEFAQQRRAEGGDDHQEIGIKVALAQGVKGIVFTEFLEMVESRFGLEVADRMIESAALKSRGAYTAVGTYDHEELIWLTSELSWLTGTAPAKLIWDLISFLL